MLDNLTAVLEAAGAGWRDVVRTTIYLADLGDFALVNKLYGERVGVGVLPARSTVQVARLPRGAAVEIDAVAHAPAPRFTRPGRPPHPWPRRSGLILDGGGASSRCSPRAPGFHLADRPHRPARDPRVFT